ncbi:MAG: hypothetical protein M0Z51_17675 [Propionibacterium sp.]|nr:hypothetical protein [Propionibacterium sp.]
MPETSSPILVPTDPAVSACDRVLVMGATSYEWAIADFAIWRCGAVAVPVSTASPVQVATVSARMTVAHVADPARAVASLAEVRPGFLVVTSTGKNIAPAGSERLVERDGAAEHAVVVGDRRPTRPPCCACRTPSRGASTPEPMRSSTTRTARRPAEGRGRRQRHRLPDHQVKRWLALRVPLTEGAGHLTPTGKVRRTRADQANDLIERLHRGALGLIRG